METPIFLEISYFFCKIDRGCRNLEVFRLWIALSKTKFYGLSHHFNFIVAVLLLLIYRIYIAFVVQFHGEIYLL